MGRSCAFYVRRKDSDEKGPDEEGPDEGKGPDEEGPDEGSDSWWEGTDDLYRIFRFEKYHWLLDWMDNKLKNSEPLILHELSLEDVEELHEATYDIDGHADEANLVLALHFMIKRLRKGEPVWYRWQ